jgi:hypothetical protein
MGYRGRETERKLTTDLLSYDQVVYELTSLISTPHMQDYSTDWYWDVPNTKDTFARVRQYPDGHFEMTIKQEDKGIYQDRIELDIPTRTDVPKYDIMAYNEIAFGPRIGTIKKHYSVWFLDDAKHNSVSCYKIEVNGKEIDKVFVEVEGTSLEYVDAVLKQLPFLMTECEGSLYTMYLKPK